MKFLSEVTILFFLLLPLKKKKKRGRGFAVVASQVNRIVKVQRHRLKRLKVEFK